MLTADQTAEDAGDGEELLTADLVNFGMLDFGMQNTGVTFKVRFLGKHPSPGKQQQGFVQLWKAHGKKQNGKDIPFDFPDELPRKMRQILKAAKIRLP